MPLMKICCCGGCPGCRPGPCRQLTSVPVGGRCESCAPSHLARDAERRAAKPQRKIWDSARWQRTRARVLARDGHRCVDCGRHKSQLKKNERLLADHVRGLRRILAEGGDAFDERECETRCSTCSGRKDGGLR